MIGGFGGGPTTVSSSVQSFGGSLPSSEVLDGTLVRRSAASMLSGKRPAQAAPSVKKAVSTKSASTKKGDGAGHGKILKPVEVEDAAVITPSETSLEEIEDKLGSLIQADTITLFEKYGVEKGIYVLLFWLLANKGQ